MTYEPGTADILTTCDPPFPGNRTCTCTMRAAHTAACALAEDEAIVIEALRRALRDGYATRWYAHGPRALDLTLTLDRDDFAALQRVQHR